MTDDSGAVTNASSLESAAERIRETSKWLLAAFGAVGVIVIAGVTLSDLGTITDQEARLAASLSVMLALVGVVIAVLAAGSVVTRSFITLANVAADSKKHVVDDLVLAGLGSAAELRDAYVAALTKHRETAAELYTHLGSDLGAGTTQDAFDSRTVVLTRKAEAAGELVAFYEGLVYSLLSRQSFLAVSAAYRKARLGMAGGAVLAVTGILLFVSITTQPSGAPVVGNMPVSVTVSVRDAGRARVADLLGGDCDLEKITGTAIANEGETVVIAVPRSAKCEAALLRLSPAEAVVRKLK